MAAFGIGVGGDSAQQLINFRFFISELAASGGDEEEINMKLSGVVRSMYEARFQNPRGWKAFTTDFLAKPTWPMAGDGSIAKEENLQHAVRLFVLYADKFPQVLHSLQLPAVFSVSYLRALLIATLIASSASGTDDIGLPCRGALCSDEQICEGICSMMTPTNEVCDLLLINQYSINQNERRVDNLPILI